MSTGSLQSGRISITPSATMKTIWLLCACVLSMHSHAQPLPVAPLNIGVHLIRAELAVSDEERARGLMFRQSMGENEGMAFRFPHSRQVCMWMKNTLIPLSVAFISEDGRIINIEDMQPQTLEPHCAKRPARFALEMNQGWFRKRGIQPGTAVSGLPK